MREFGRIMLETYQLFLLALVIWREARGEVMEAKSGVAWTVLNRAAKPGWWGKDVIGCILQPWQFSSFNKNDPNAVKFPSTTDQSWMDSFMVAQQAMAGTLADPTQGATSYFDSSIAPPSWATDGSNAHTVDLGSLHFYRLVG